MSNTSGIYATEISSALASEFWYLADTASVFCHPSYLSEMGYSAKYFGAYKGNELLIVWPILLHPNTNSASPSFSYYFGPFCKNNPAKLPSYRAYSTNLLLLEELIGEVVSEVSEISFSLLPEFIDIRPFLWWNYHEPKKPKFKIDVKYTARFDLKSSGDTLRFDNFFRPDDKRKRFRKIAKENPFFSLVNDCKDFEKLVCLYDETLERSGGKASSADLHTLEKLLVLTRNHNTELNSYILEAYLKDSGVLVGFQLLLGSKNTIYAIAQSSTLTGRESSANIFLTHESFCFAKNKGFEIFDFNGANSPNRADDKHSYGAAAQPYFELCFTKNNGEK